MAQIPPGNQGACQPGLCLLLSGKGREGDARAATSPLHENAHAETEISSKKEGLFATEGQVALSSPRPFPRLQGDNTGHSKVRTDAPTKGKRSCQPRGWVVPLPLSPRAAPRSSPLQVLPAATFSCRALSPRASRALWTQRLCSSLPDLRFLSQHPWTVSADLRTGFLFAYILPISSVPCEPFRFPALPQIPQQHSRLLTTCCPQRAATFPRLTLPFGSQPKLYLLLRYPCIFPDPLLSPSPPFQGSTPHTRLLLAFTPSHPARLRTAPLLRPGWAQR